MPTVVGVRFKEAGKLYHFTPGGLGLRRLDKVVVETSAGLSVGRVVTEPQEKDPAELPKPVRRVLRKATEEDLRREKEARRKAEQALEECRRRVREAGLAMRPVDAECTIDGGRVTIHYTSAERVDF